MLSLSKFFEVPEGVEFSVNGDKYKIIDNVLLSGINDFEPSITRLNWFIGKEIKIIPPKKTISEDEKVILRNLPSEFTWIARDKDGDLFIFSHKPTRNIKVWVENKCDTSQSCKSIDLFQHLFQCIKWEDEEATLISDLLKED